MDDSVSITLRDILRRGNWKSLCQKFVPYEKTTNLFLSSLEEYKPNAMEKNQPSFKARRTSKKDIQKDNQDLKPEWWSQVLSNDAGWLSSTYLIVYWNLQHWLTFVNNPIQGGKDFYSLRYSGKNR